MKRISIVLTLLLAIGLVGAFAIDDYEPVVDFSASAETTFGVDLNEEMSTGFDTSAEADLSVTFAPTEVEKGEGDVYGWIKIEDIEFGMMIDEGTDPEDSSTFTDDGEFDGLLAASIGDISARVIYDPAYLQISTVPDMSFENAEALRLKAADDNDPIDTIGTNDLVEPNGGIKIGADNLAEMIDVAFKIGSHETYEKSYDGDKGGSWVATVYNSNTDTYTYPQGTGPAPPVGYSDDDDSDDVVGVSPDYEVQITENQTVLGVTVGEDYTAGDKAANTEHYYVMGFDVTVRPIEMLTVDASIVINGKPDSPVGYTLNPVFSMNMLEVGVPMDATYRDKGRYKDDGTFVTNGNEELDYEIAPYATYDLTDDGSHVGVWSFFQSTTESYLNVDPVLDVKFGAKEVSGGFVPGLETALYGYFFDVMTRVGDKQSVYNGQVDSMALGVHFSASYDVDGIKPFLDMKYATQEDSMFGPDHGVTNVDYLDAAMLQDDDTVFDADEVLMLEAGVEIAKISNTVFTLKYASDNLFKENPKSYELYENTNEEPEVGMDLGEITFSTEITY